MHEYRFVCDVCDTVCVCVCVCHCVCVSAGLSVMCMCMCTFVFGCIYWNIHCIISYIVGRTYTIGHVHVYWTYCR